MPSTELSTHLTKIRALIANPSSWTKGTLAKNDAGVVCDPRSPNAKSFCLNGAMIRTAPSVFSENETYDYVRDRLGTSIGQFNDNHTHTQVLQALDEAIEAAP